MEHVGAAKDAGRGKGDLFGDINKLRDAQDDEEDAEAKEMEKYDQTTFAGKIAINPYFEYITLAIIMGNAAYLGIDCDYNARWGKPDDLYANPSGFAGFILFDHLFCLYFTVELIIRFAAYKNKSYFIRDGWFMFDLFLVALMVIETWILAFVGTVDALKQVSILRLLRLCRLFRMAKLMRYFPELQLIVKGMVAALRSVMCALVLMMLVLYVFAIIFVGEYKVSDAVLEAGEAGPAEDLFGRSIPRAMKYLLIMGTILDDLTFCTNSIRYSGGNGHNATTMLMVFWICVIICGFTLFSMLLGLLCEVVEATKDGEKKKAQTKELKKTIQNFFVELDVDGNGQVTRQEFLSMRHHPDLGAALEKLDIAPEDFDKYAAILFTPEHEGDPPPVLHYQECVRMIMRLRPGHDVNACDFRLFQEKMISNNATILRDLEEFEGMLLGMGALEPDETDLSAVRNFDEDDGYPGGVRPPPSIKDMAKTGGGMGMSQLPPDPMTSKWSETSPKNPRKDDSFDARVASVVDKKRSIKNQQRESMYGEQLSNQQYQNSAAYNMPPLRNAGYENEGEPPFSPNQMVFAQ